MIGYVTVGSNDLEKALPFYDELLAVMGVTPAFDLSRGGRMYGKNPGKFDIGVNTPFDEKAASVGNGMMIAFEGDSPEQVQAVYDKALELGGSCEGKPGWRGPEGGFFGAYFRDLDGNKLCIYNIGAK